LFCRLLIFFVFFLWSSSNSLSLLLFRFSFRAPPSVLSLPQDVRPGGETYAPEAAMSFLSTLVSSPSAAQAAAKDLWSARVSSKTEAEVQSAMAG
jgi:hypothetical protein